MKRLLKLADEFPQLGPSPPWDHRWTLPGSSREFLWSFLGASRELPRSFLGVFVSIWRPAELLEASGSLALHGSSSMFPPHLYDSATGTGETSGSQRSLIKKVPRNEDRNNCDIMGLDYTGMDGLHMHPARKGSKSDHQTNICSFFSLPWFPWGFLGSFWAAFRMLFGCLVDHLCES